jgi:hypothetical protein
MLSSRGPAVGLSACLLFTRGHFHIQLSTASLAITVFDGAAWRQRHRDRPHASRSLDDDSDADKRRHPRLEWFLQFGKSWAATEGHGGRARNPRSPADPVRNRPQQATRTHDSRPETGKQDARSSWKRLSRVNKKGRAVGCNLDERPLSLPAMLGPVGRRGQCPRYKYVCTYMTAGGGTGRASPTLSLARPLEFLRSDRRRRLTSLLPLLLLRVVCSGRCVHSTLGGHAAAAVQAGGGLVRWAGVERRRLARRLAGHPSPQILWTDLVPAPRHAFQVDPRRGQTGKVGARARKFNCSVDRSHRSQALGDCATRFSRTAPHSHRTALCCRLPSRAARRLAAPQG